MSTKREFKLKKSKDWDAWLAVIKDKAIDYQIWDQIDSSLAIKPQQLQKPQEVEKSNENVINDNLKVYTKYKFQLIAYKIKEIKWKKQYENLSKMTDLIYDTMNIINFTYIQKMKMHFWNLLKALKARLTFFDSTRFLKFERNYKRFRKKFINKQNVETWLNDYVQMYILTKKNDIIKIINTRRAYWDFLLIIESQASILAQMHEYQINTKMNKEKLFFEIIEKFRIYIRLREVKKLTKNIADNLTFSIFTASASEDKFKF